MNENSGVYELQIPLFTRLGERSNRNGVLYTREAIEKAWNVYIENHAQIAVALGRDVGQDDLLKATTVELDKVVGIAKSYDDTSVTVSFKSKPKYDLVKELVEHHGYHATFSMFCRLDEAHRIIVEDQLRLVCVDLKA